MAGEELKKQFQAKFLPMEPKITFQRFLRLHQTSLRAQHAVSVPAIPMRSEASKILRQKVTQDMSVTIEQQPWYSYCVSTSQSEQEFNEIIDFAQRRNKVNKEDFLIYQHFEDPRPSNPDSACKGDHYHVLFRSDFKSISGNINKPSQSYHFEFFNKFSQKHSMPKPSCKAVKSIFGYLDYLKVFPRQLCAYSPNFVSLVEDGFFHPSIDLHRAYVNDYVKRMTGEGYTHYDVVPNREQQPITIPESNQKITEADRVFNEIRNFISESKCRSEQELLKWAVDQGEPTRTRILLQLFGRHNFSFLVNKAIASLQYEKKSMTWYDKLCAWTPKKGYMSIKDSIEIVKLFHTHNGILQESTDTQMSLTATLDSVLSKRIKKINTIAFFGGSNAGKSIILRSAFEVYPDCAIIYPGADNNFMFAQLVNSSVALWEECEINPKFQETSKLLWGGEEFKAAVKYGPDELVTQTPLGVSGNIESWRTVLQRENKEAFKNRCHAYYVSSCDELKAWRNKGRINPQVWLHLDKRYWSKQQGKENFRIKMFFDSFVCTKASLRHHNSGISFLTGANYDTAEVSPAQEYDLWSDGKFMLQ